MKPLLLSILILLLTPPLAYAMQTKSPSEIIDSWHNKALELKNEGKYDEAETIFKKILTAEPTNPNAHFDLGNVYLYQKRYNEAISCYNEAIRLELDKRYMADYHFNLSLCYIGLDNNKDAIYHLKQCLKINPDYPDAKNLLELVEDAYKRGEKLEIEEVD